jgi:hypothetical protein
MAGSPEPVPEVNHGWKGAIFALIFSLVIVGGASIATADAVDGRTQGHSEDHGEDHSDEEHSDEDHSDG